MVFGRRAARERFEEQTRALEAWAQSIGWRQLPGPHPEPPSIERAQNRSVEAIAVVGSPPGSWHRRVGAWERRTANLGSPISFENSELVAAIAIPPRPPQSPLVVLGSIGSHLGRGGVTPVLRVGGPRTGATHASYPPLGVAQRHFTSPWGFLGVKLWGAPDIPPPVALAGLAEEIEARAAWLMMGERELEISVPLGTMPAGELMGFVDRAAITLGRPAP